MTQVGASALVDRERVRAATGFVVLGMIGIIGGGLVSAATGPLSWDHGSWATAYLVLVVGIAQLVFGVGQAWLADDPPGGLALTGELVGWNLGSALVIAGAVLERPVLVDVGGALLVVALGLFLAMVRPRRPRAVPSWARWVYLVLAVVILVSIPIGLTLAATNGR